MSQTTPAVIGENIVCTLSASITDVGSETNTIDTVTITTADGTTIYEDNGSNNNYTVTRQEGTLEITGKDLETTGIEISQPENKTYDGTPQIPDINVTDARIQSSGRELVENTDYTLSYEANIVAGKGSVKVSGLGNYTGTVIKEFTIMKRPIKITSKNIEKPYDGTALSSTGIGDLTSDNLAPGDQLARVTFTGSGTNVGETANTYEGLVIENAAKVDVTSSYNITPIYGTITIRSISNTIQITGNPGKSYDGIPVENPSYIQGGTGEVTFQYYTKSGGDYTLLDKNPQNAGDYYVKAKVAKGENHDAAETDYVGFNITKRTMTITPDDQSSSYGEQLESLTYKIDVPVIEADAALNITPVTTATSNSKVGVYPITVEMDPTARLNYIITVTPSEYKITPATLQVIASGHTGRYDAQSHGINVSVPEVPSATIYYGETEITKDNYNHPGVAMSTSPTYTNTGSYQVYYYIRANNYWDASGSKMVEISRGEQILTAEDVTLGYDGKPHSIQATTSGDGTITYQDNGQIEAGTYTVTFSASQTTNYEAASGTASLTISKRPLTIKAKSGSKIFNGTPLTAGGYDIVSGTLAERDKISSITVSGSLIDAGTSANEVREAHIQTDDATGDDRTESYEIIYKDGELAITPAEQTPPDGLMPQNETIETKGDGKITGIKVGMEYRKAGQATYTPVTQEMVDKGEIKDLISGTYEIRYAEKKNYNPSASTQVVVGFDTPAIYELALAVPAFTPVAEGYTQPKAETLNIISKGNAAVTIVSVIATNKAAFQIIGSGNTVAADGNLESYHVRPVAGLKAGFYRSDIIVTYNNNATVTGEVFFQVPPGQNTDESEEPDSNPESQQPPSKPESQLPVIKPEIQIPENKQEILLPTTDNSNVGPNTDQTNPEESEEATSPNLPEESSGDSQNMLLKDKKVFEEEILQYGKGKIQISVECTQKEDRRIDAALASTEQVVKACLSEQEKQAVANGDSIEIRLTVALEQSEVPKSDEQLITQQLNDLSTQIQGITLGEYVDITLAKRLNSGAWKSIPQAKEDIAIEIAIPEWLQFPNTDYFVSRAHNGEVTLLEDVDDKTETITILSQYFSTYAIFYTRSEASDCFWHIVILVLLGCYLLLILLSRRQSSKKSRMLLLVCAVFLFLTAAILGQCALDWFVAIASTIVAAVARPACKLLTKSDEENEISK